MFLKDCDNCHFVVWTKNEVIMINVGIYQDFLHEVIPQAKKIFINCVLPELYCKYYTVNKQ